MPNKVALHNKTLYTFGITNIVLHCQFLTLWKKLLHIFSMIAFILKCLWEGLPTKFQNDSKPFLKYLMKQTTLKILDLLFVDF